MRSSTLLALAASLSQAAAVYQGFNYGATKTDGSFRYQADFQALFKTAKNLVGASGFTSARLYTTIQGGSSTNEPTQAIPAAIAEGTSLLLGLWASAGQGPFDAEITALQSAIDKYGTSFTNLVAGISVGSEDLYRISPTGIAAKSGYGADPATIASYISELRGKLAGGPLAGAPIGHVDTWTAWVNGSNQAVINACDWIGMDAYPYFQNTQANSIQNGKSLFNAALTDTKNAVGGKPVWVTETGWPVSGTTENLAVPNTDNAKAYWQQVGCPLFGTTNTWWFTLEDNDVITVNPSFAVTNGNPLSTTPYFDLSCSAGSSSPSSSAGGSSSSPSPSSSSSVSVVASSQVSSAASSQASSAASSAASSVASSAASSASSAATGGAVVTPGGGLTPSQGAGNGIGNASGTGPAPSTVTSAAGNGTSSGSNTTGLSTTARPTGSTTSSAPVTQSTNAGNLLSGSVAGAIGALVVAAAAL